MSKYEEFKFEVTEGIRRFYRSMGQEIEVLFESKQKNNSTKVEGIIIKKENSNTNIFPCIWLGEIFDDYNHGVPVEAIVNFIVRTYEKSSIKHFDMEWFRDWEKVKGHIQCRVINTDWNQELLKTVPYIQFWDLSVIFMAETEQPQSGYITIQNSHLDLWKISKEELVNTALENSRKEGYVVVNMLDIMAEMMSEGERDAFQSEAEELPKDGPAMYVMTNEKRRFGAAVILQESCLEKAAQLIGGSYYILPSSVHELIAVDAAAADTVMSCDLTQMVREANAAAVEEEERLSSHAYFYDAVAKKVMLAGNNNYVGVGMTQLRDAV